MSIRKTVGLCALLGVAAFSLVGAAQARPVLLQSSQHDVLRMRVLDGDAAWPVPEPDDAARLVHVCVRDKAASGQRKAFDSQNAMRARFVVPHGGRRCARFEPVLQVFYFSKNKGRGMRVMLSYPLDLRGLEGAIVVFDWIRDHRK